MRGERHARWFIALTQPTGAAQPDLAAATQRFSDTQSACGIGTPTGHGQRDTVNPQMADLS